MTRLFRDRADAGRQLATHLTSYAGRPDVLVLALPRGGVPVAFEVSQSLNVTLDVVLVRKLGVPGHEELALGAIATGGIRVLNEDVVRLPLKEANVTRVLVQSQADNSNRCVADVFLRGRKTNG